MIRRVTSRGRVTIPVEMRQKFGLLPGVAVDFVEHGDGWQLVPRQRSPERPDRPLMGTEEIMKLLRSDD